MEAIGDITASAEVSRVEVVGPEFDSRIQGGILVRRPILILSNSYRLMNSRRLQSDGIGGFLSACFTVAPVSCFAQVRRFLALDSVDKSINDSDKIVE